MATTYWITGYSGAGKSSIGIELYRILKKKKDACVILDGDTLREVLSDDLSYTKEDRFKSAMRFARLCWLLTSQGIDVICCTVSMFNDVRAWNRKNINNYIEVYLRVSVDILRQRDQKNLYSGHIQGTVSNVAGLDIQMDEPINPDIIIENDGSISAVTAADKILKGESYYA
jgi:adenylylsulfate kinase